MEEIGKSEEIWMRIVENTITKEEAIVEYMKLGDSRKDAEKIYEEIRSEVCKGELGWG